MMVNNGCGLIEAPLILLLIMLNVTLAHVSMIFLCFCVLMFCCVIIVNLF